MIFENCSKASPIEVVKKNNTETYYYDAIWYKILKNNIEIHIPVLSKLEIASKISNNETYQLIKNEAKSLKNVLIPNVSRLGSIGSLIVKNVRTQQYVRNQKHD